MDLLTARILRRRPLSYTVLVLFILDRSLSMMEPKTYDRRGKWFHLIDLVEALLKRLARSRMMSAFLVGFVWFSDDVEIVEVDGQYYFPVAPYNVALEVFRQSIERNHPYGMTAIADALEAASKVVERYIDHFTLPPEKYGTVLLFTDGRETKRSVEDVISAAERITFKLAERLRSLDERNRLGLATIALGQDADRETLREIASYLREAQRRVLEERGLLELVDPPYHEKMFIDAPLNDHITKEWEEAVRRFLERLSETAVI